MPVEWFEAQFRLPTLQSCSDEELERLYMERDGTWSASTKAALARFGTKLLDLNENWASTPPNWQCPGCERRKPEIFRLLDNGVLLGRLVEHHDHLTDRFKALAQARFGSDWISKIPDGTKHLEKLASRLVARFEPTLVCQECNNADAVAKRGISQVHADFSFRPSEIRTFVRSVANGEHIVDLAAARATHDAEQADFEARLALVGQIFALLVAGALVCEKGNQPPSGALSSTGMLRHLHRWFAWEHGELYRQISRDLSGFEMRSVARDGAAASANTRKRPLKVETPTPEEVAGYDGGGAPELWRAAGDAWTCPSCERSKAQILRRSRNRNRRWAGKLLRHTEFVVAESWDEDGLSAADAFIDHHRVHLICMDCATILPGLKQRKPRYSNDDALLQIGDMVAVLRAAPNQPHQIDWERAAARADDNFALAPLVRAYWVHHNAAVNCRALFNDCLERTRGNRERAWNRLVALYADDHGSAEECAETLQFLLEEADRIGIGDPFRLPQAA